MLKRIWTRGEECTLLCTVYVNGPCDINFIAKHSSLQNLVFTQRKRSVADKYEFYVRLPLVGIHTGIIADNADKIDIQMLPLEKRMDVRDIYRPGVQAFIRFMYRFCYYAGTLEDNVNYHSELGKFTIKYMPVLRDLDDGHILTTPARTNMDTKVMEISANSYRKMTLPARVLWLLHEFSHAYMNDFSMDEKEADINALIIYLSLGWPRVDAKEAARELFTTVDTKLNEERYNLIIKFINDFEKDNVMFR